MVRLRYASRAIDDFRTLFRYGVTHWGAAVAYDYLASFDPILALIADYPRSGRARPRLGASQRSIVHGSHVIYYWLSVSEVLIVRVLHGAADARRQLKRSSRRANYT